MNLQIFNQPKLLKICNIGVSLGQKILLIEDCYRIDHEKTLATRRGNFPDFRINRRPNDQRHFCHPEHCHREKPKALRGGWSKWQQDSAVQPCGLEMHDLEIYLYGN